MPVSSASPVPDGWQRVRLGDVCAPPEYGAAASARPFDPKLPRYVRITDITDDGRLRADNARSAPPAKVEGYELKAGDLMFARSGSVGRTYLYCSEDGPCVFAGYLIRFRPNPEIALPRFVELYTHSFSYRRWIASILRVGAQPNINAAEYSSLPILLPPLPEQRAIAAVLDTIDEAIERTEEVIATTERLRDALLHELLGRGLPGHHTAWREVHGLGTIPACWEVVRLGDVGRFVNGRAFKPSDWGESGLPIVRIQNLTSPDAPFNYYEGPVTSDNLIDNGDIVVSWSASIEARTWNRGPAILNQHIFKVMGHRGVADKRFLFFLLDATTGELRQRVHGTTMQHVTKGTFDSTRVVLPPLSEQWAIATTLDSVDTTIKRAREERAALQSAKASTADALLTGRVRVPTERAHA